MRKWLFRLSIAIAVLALAIILFLVNNAYDSQTVFGHLKNDELSTNRDGWPGNAIDQKGRFINDEFPFLSKTYAVLKWQLSKNPSAAEKSGDTFKLEVRDPRPFLESDGDGILWLGHASFYIRLNGVGILTDPIFGTPAFFNRLVEVPSQLEHIRRVDYVLLSHDHRDHMDEASLRAIAQKFPNATFLAGLRSEDVLNDWKTASSSTLTAGWFQKFTLPSSGLNIYFYPARHWSQRYVLDANRRLWGSFVIETDKATIYFGGDSGYGRHYREVAELHPRIDYFLIGIGAYEPRWIMEPNHNNPAEALQGFRDSGAKVMLPMHHGTFDLSNEPPGTPSRTLQKLAAEAGLSERIRSLEINEAIAIGGDEKR